MKIAAFIVFSIILIAGRGILRLVGLLRILLAVCVLCWHGRPLGGLHWLRGDMAVELFFVISGFYMQLVLSGKYTRPKLGRMWVARFYQARYFRLLPAYLLASLIVLAAGAVQPDLGPWPTLRAVWQLPSTAANNVFRIFLPLTDLTMLFQDVTMFFSTHAGVVHGAANFRDSDLQLWQGLTIPPAWSLGIELTFYLLAPWLLNLRSGWLAVVAFLGLVAKLMFLQATHLQDLSLRAGLFPYRRARVSLPAATRSPRARPNWQVLPLPAGDTLRDFSFAGAGSQPDLSAGARPAPPCLLSPERQLEAGSDDW